MKLPSLILLTTLSSSFANAAIYFEKLDCANDKHQVHIERLNSYQLQVSISKLAWDQILPPRKRIAIIKTRNQVVTYEESYASISAEFRSVIGETILGTKLRKRFKLKIKEDSASKLTTEYNNSGEIPCRVSS